MDQKSIGRAIAIGGTDSLLILLEIIQLEMIIDWLLPTAVGVFPVILITLSHHLRLPTTLIRALQFQKCNCFT